MGKKEIEVLIRAIGWWRAHRPVGWKEAKHILNPAINTTTHKELKLAYAVRAREDANNHYLQTLKRSKLWEVYCSEETYQQIHALSGFALKKWIDDNINWQDDFKKEIDRKSVV